MERNRRLIEGLYVWTGALLNVHEVDSAYWQEWRLFGGRGASRRFVIASLVLAVPFMYGLVFLVRSPRLGARYGFALVFPGRGCVRHPQGGSLRRAGRSSGYRSASACSRPRSSRRWGLAWQSVASAGHRLRSERLRGDACATEQGDEADEAFGGTVPRMKVPPHARAGRVDAGTASQLIAVFGGPRVSARRRNVVAVTTARCEEMRHRERGGGDRAWGLGLREHAWRALLRPEPGDRRDGGLGAPWCGSLQSSLLPGLQSAPSSGDARASRAMRGGTTSFVFTAGSRQLVTWLRYWGCRSLMRVATRALAPSGGIKAKGSVQVHDGDSPVKDLVGRSCRRTRR